MKKTVKTMLLLLIVTCISSFVFASSYSFNVQADKEIVVGGDEVTLALNISDIDSRDLGINVVEGFIEYDKDLYQNFEIIDMNDWETTYNEATGKFLVCKDIEGASETETIALLKFKMIDNLDIDETIIKLIDITSNDGIELMDDGTTKIKLRMEKKNMETGDINVILFVMISVISVIGINSYKKMIKA